MLEVDEANVSPDFTEQVEELQVIIFNRLQPFKIQQSKLDLSFNLSSSDLLTSLNFIVSKSNEGLMAD